MSVISDLTSLSDTVFGKSGGSETSGGGGTGSKKVVDSGTDVKGTQVKSGGDTTSDTVNAVDILGKSNTTSGNMTNNSTAASVNTTTNSGTTNEIKTAGSQNVTTNSGSKNTTTNSGSVNSLVNSGSVNNNKTSGRTDTVQLLLNQQAVDHLVQQIFEGTQGLAAVSGGQKTSGGYDSTTNQQLVNDLVSRTAGEVAARSAATQTTIGGTDDFNYIGGNTATQTIGGSNSVTDIGGSTSTTNIGATDVIQSLGGSTTTNNIGATSGTSMNVGTSLSNNSQTNNGTSTTNTTSTPTTTTSDINTGPRTTIEDDVMVNNPVKTDTHSDGLLSKLGWIICTELHKQGRLPIRIYIPGSRRFATYDETIKRGYYFWAVACVAHLKKHPCSAFSNFLEYVFNKRAEQIAAQAGIRDYKKTVMGAICLAVPYALCYVLGHTIARTNNYQPTNVYGD